MMTLYNFLWLAAIPALAMPVGALCALVKIPGPRLTSGAQHFAAGVVFAAVAIELLPEMSGNVHDVATVIGFFVGVVLMLVIKHVTGRLSESRDSAQLPSSMLAVLAIDLAVDGLLVGVALIATPQAGLIVTLALAIEIFFLGVSSAATLGQRGIAKAKTAIVCLVLGLDVLASAGIGAYLAEMIAGAPLAAIIAFGVAALLYLVTEELLHEAHEQVSDSPLVTATFFLGFVFIFMLKRLIG